MDVFEIKRGVTILDEVWMSIISIANPINLTA